MHFTPRVEVLPLGAQLCLQRGGELGCAHRVRAHCNLQRSQRDGVEAGRAARLSRRANRVHCRRALDVKARERGGRLGALRVLWKALSRPILLAGVKIGAIVCNKPAEAAVLASTARIAS